MKNLSNKAIQYLKERSGYAFTRELKALGLQSRDIEAFVDDGTLIKIKRGLYKLSIAPVYEHSQLVDICVAKPQAVIALVSALEFFDLTTYSPSEITIALPQNYTYNSFKNSNLPVQIFYFPKRYYSFAVETINLKGGEIRIFNREKTICDMFRYRKTFGEDIALEGLKNYLGSKNANIQILQKTASLCDVSQVLTPYLKAMVIK